MTLYGICFFFFVALRPNAGQALLILEASRSHSTTHHSRYDSSGRVVSSSQRPLPENTQHPQQTNIHAAGGIRTHDLSRPQTALDRAATGTGCTENYWSKIHITHMEMRLFTCEKCVSTWSASFKKKLCCFHRQAKQCHTSVFEDLCKHGQTYQLLDVDRAHPG